MSTEFELPELKQAIERLDDLFATAFSSNDEAMQDWVAVRFAIKAQSAPSNSDYTAAQCVNDICAQYGLYGKGVEAWLLSRIERLNSGKAPNFT